MRVKKETYKFRAECISDVLNFMAVARFPYDIKIVRKKEFKNIQYRMLKRRY